MVVAVRLADDAPEGALDAALAAVAAALTTRSAATGTGEIAPPRTTGAALRLTPEAFTLVSVPGASALVEAVDALDAGRDVMIFSDNVPVDQEVALKRMAAERGLLVMGPDCGTAVVGGLGLGFANACRPGPVGLVAASGTGCQQLLSPARPRGRRRDPRARRRRTRPVGRGGRAGHPRGGTPPRRRSDRRAGRGRLQAACPGGGRRPDDVSPGPRHPRRARPPGPGAARPDRCRRAGARAPGSRGPRLAGSRRRARRRAARAPARALRRRDPLHRGAGSSRPRPSGPTRARSPTSATTSTRAAAPTP